MSSRSGTSTKVLALFGKGITIMSGCEIYRVTQPLERLNETGLYNCSWMPIDVVPYVGDSVLDFDIYVLPRYWIGEAELEQQRQSPTVQALIENGVIPSDSKAPLVDMLHYYGKKVVYEVDDDFTNEHRIVHGGGSNAMSVASACDAVIVSTPYLQELMQKVTHKPAFLCRNYLDPKVWRMDGMERTIEGLTIGLTGSKTHYGDWEVLKDVLPRILKRFPKVKLVVGGFQPDYLPEESEQVMYVQPLPYIEYSFSLRAMDILLVPVNPAEKFNWSKSPIKAIEGMAAHRLLGSRDAGAAVIATDMPVYRDAIQGGENGILVEHSPEAWEAAIISLVMREATRKALQLKGYKWVTKNRNINTGWQDWHKAFQRIASREA